MDAALSQNPQHGHSLGTIPALLQRDSHSRVFLWLTCVLEGTGRKPRTQPGGRKGGPGARPGKVWSVEEWAWALRRSGRRGAMCGSARPLVAISCGCRVLGALRGHLPGADLATHLLLHGKKRARDRCRVPRAHASVCSAGLAGALSTQPDPSRQGCGFQLSSCRQDVGQLAVRPQETEAEGTEGRRGRVSGCSPDAGRALAP